MNITKAMGLDRAARDRVGEAEPWYDPSGGLMPLLEGFSLPELHALLDEVTETELAAAQAPARALVHDFGRVVEALELAHGRGVAGLGTAQMLRPQRVEVAVLVATRAVRLGLLEAIEKITAPLASAPIQRVLAKLPEAQTWLRTHRDRRRIRRIGLVAYQEAQAARGRAATVNA